MWYNLDTIRGRLDDIYYFIIKEKRIMEELRFFIQESYQRVKIGLNVQLVQKYAVVLDGRICGEYESKYEAQEAIVRFGHVWMAGYCVD